jgi:hypothetical protein
VEQYEEVAQADVNEALDGLEVASEEEAAAFAETRKSTRKPRGKSKVDEAEDTAEEAVEEAADDSEDLEGLID